MGLEQGMLRPLCTPVEWPAAWWGPVAEQEVNSVRTALALLAPVSPASGIAPATEEGGLNLC